MEQYSLSRPAIALSDQEKGLVRGMAALLADRVIIQQTYDAFISELVWGGGQATFTASRSVLTHRQEPIARGLLLQVLKQLMQPYQQFLAVTANRLATERHNGRPSGAAISRFLNQGNAWLELDPSTPSDTFSLNQTPRSLVIGFNEAGNPVHFDGNESLITIAGPGTGKSQAQVIRNLLRYPGSCFVLDVKGELWDATAAFRQRHIGPVLRFAPTDPSGNTNAYNPFDFVSRDPQQAAVDCEVISSQIIPQNSGAKDPFWDNRARDFLWVFSLATALSAEPHRRNLAMVMEMLALPVTFDTDEAYQASPTPAVVARLKELAKRFDIPALAESAVAIESSQNDRMDGVFDAARRYLSIFSRSSRLRQAMSRSDWSPLDLRARPGTTVYLCLSGDDIDTYTPIVRLIVQQHANLLLRPSPQATTQPPITFFLDEFPQLDRMESIQRLLDVGRGAGLRLWLFAQYMGQLRETYDKRADGLISACRVRCFMQPDNEAAKYLGPQLGTVEHLFSGKTKPLAEPYELMGAAFRDKVIVTARGHDPLLLNKRYAFQDLAGQMTGAPPDVRRR